MTTVHIVRTGDDVACIIENGPVGMTRYAFGMRDECYSSVEQTRFIDGVTALAEALGFTAVDIPTLLVQERVARFRAAHDAEQSDPQIHEGR